MRRIILPGQYSNTRQPKAERRSIPRLKVDIALAQLLPRILPEHDLHWPLGWFLAIPDHKLPKLRGDIKISINGFKNIGRIFQGLAAIGFLDHSLRTALYVFLLVDAKKEAWGINEKEVNEIVFAALLHDVGKILAFPQIWTAPRRLNGDELYRIKQHPLLGGAFLRETGCFSPNVISMVETHHEMLDGSGYPFGIKLPDILLRILPIADKFDAIINPRIYRKKRLSIPLAFEELEYLARLKKLDPVIVKAFKEVLCSRSVRWKWPFSENLPILIKPNLIEI